MKGWTHALPFVLAAPSGAGKTSLARSLVERHEEIVFSVSATTRPPREYERDGVDYHFVDDAEFEAMEQRGELLEWAWVHGRRYGTPVSSVRDALAQGRTVMLDIDVQGARQVRDKVPGAVLVFILPPSGTELLRRLTGRASESDDERAARLRTALGELQSADDFDYVVVNDRFEDTLGVLEAILTAERHRANGSRDKVREEMARLADEVSAFIARGGS